MTALLVTLLAADLVLNAIVGTLLHRARRDGRSRTGELVDELEARSVVIHTRDGKSLAGVLLAARPDGFLVENADTLTPDGRISIGTVVVPRANVSFFQRLPGEAS